MPQASQHHRDHNVAHFLEATMPVPSQRNVEIVPEPARERNVPASPEIDHRGRRVGLQEVFRKAHAEHERDRLLAQREAQRGGRAPRQQVQVVRRRDRAGRRLGDAGELQRCGGHAEQHAHR